MDIRRSDFAGSWYPSTAEGCTEEIQRYLSEPVAAPGTEGSRIGGIVPHAGWYYSGAIACRLIHMLKTDPPPDVVVLFGMHLSPEARPVILARGAWQTPFGRLPVAEDLADRLTGRFIFHVESPRTARQDNTIELQLPFVNHLFGDVKILPIGAPPAPISLDIGRAVGEIATTEKLSLRIIGSTDLTHYGPNYGFTSQGSGKAAVDWVKAENDRRFIDAILALDGRAAINESLVRHNACCGGAAAAALEAALALGADRAELSEYRTSYDKRPDESFVGYSGIVFYRSDETT